MAKLAEALRDQYIFPDVGQKAAAKISARLAAGDYDSVSDPAGFAARLSTDVAAVARDKHLNVWSTVGSPAPAASKAEMMPRQEAGITRADRLQGGVGYIEVVGFPPLDGSKRAIDKAMNSLGGSKALIIDLRRNGGGSPETVAYLVSFLLPAGPPIAINDIVARTAKTTEFTRKSFSSVPTPIRFDRVPVYVLTSGQTFSGGEEFAYDVQALKRGTLVGEITGGGANPASVVELGHGLAASIPDGRAENPITKSNWESVGVQPEVRVAAKDALKVALERLGQKPMAEIETASIEQVFAPRSAPLEGTEAALRKLVAGLAAGNPDYSAMLPDFAKRTREQLPQLQRQLSALGALQNVRFHGPLMTGDEFLLSFANGKAMMAIMLDANGKIEEALPPLPISAEE